MFQVVTGQKNDQFADTPIYILDILYFDWVISKPGQAQNTYTLFYKKLTLRNRELRWQK